jgi:hypothetical protein
MRTPVCGWRITAAPTAGTMARVCRLPDGGQYLGGPRVDLVGKRFIVTDALGMLLTVVIVTAAVQDRDGAKPALLQAYLCTQVRFVFSD